MHKILSFIRRPLFSLKRFVRLGKGEIPGNVESAIKQYLAFGDDTKNKSHNGYYSEGGWPYEILKKYIGGGESA